MSDRPALAYGPRLRRSPYFEATRRWGVAAWTTYNHMLMPAHYGDPEGEYRALVNDVTLWDVAAQRQVEVTGPDARAFLEYLTPRDLEGLTPGRGRYVILCDEQGGVVNDPVLFCLSETQFWLSAADSDILLWIKGASLGAGFDVAVREAAAWPLQLQGPRAPEVLQAVLGPDIAGLRYFHLKECEIAGIPVVVSRTGWSAERGYEIFLRDASLGDRLWELLMEAGSPFGIQPAAPNQARRIEAGLLSWGADMDLTVSPYELNMDRLVNLEKPGPFIGRQALERLVHLRTQRRLIGARIEGAPIRYNPEAWSISRDGRRIGWLTSVAWSPALETNVGLALVERGQAINTAAEPAIVASSDGHRAIRFEDLPLVPSRARD